MKIALLTFSKEINYGAELQCFAMKKVLEKMGHKVEVIDIQLKPLKFSRFNTLIHYPEKVLFSSFWNKYIKDFTRKYTSEQDILTTPPQADVYIVGSDQVWNPEITTRLAPLVYFFNFVKDGKKKIAYAASFGFEHWTDEALKPQVFHLIRQFEAVSVRESEGENICRETFGIDAVTVCDPTQLLEASDYECICGPFVEKKRTTNILYWKQIRNNRVEEAVCDFADSIGRRVLKICDLRMSKRCINRPFVSIKKWLDCIRYSDFIISDSFHCLSFCLIFKRPFVIIYDLKTRGNRIRGLLGLLGLQRRIVSSADELKERLPVIFNEDIDFKTVSQILKEKKIFSMKFISNSLE